ncbi:MAG: glycosyltransferase family 2 protein [Spirochaetia bacterium]
MVTVGIPCYNEERYIKQTLDSVLAAEEASAIIVSDNGSTDRSGEICREYAQKYPQIQYVRQEKNIGMLANWRYLFEHAHTPYFCLVGGHDTISPNYLSGLERSLEAHPEAVLAFGYTKKTDNLGHWIKDEHYDYAPSLVHRSMPKRIYQFLRHINDCSLVCGVWRLDVLKEVFFDEMCLGPDIVTMARALEKGTFVYNPDVYFGRTEPRKETHKEQIERHEKTLKEVPGKITKHWQPICVARLKEIPGGRRYYRQFQPSLIRRVGRKVKALLKKIKAMG